MDHVPSLKHAHLERTDTITTYCAILRKFACCATHDNTEVFPKLYRFILLSLSGMEAY